MKYEIAIYGSGISAKITSCLLARDGYQVCLILDKDKNKLTKNTNLVTFLSAGSLNYLSSKIPNMSFISEYPNIQTIDCQLSSLDEVNSQSISFNDDTSKPLGKIIKNIELEKFLDDDIRHYKNLITINSGSLDLIKNTKDGVNIKLQNGEQIQSDLFVLSTIQKNIEEQLAIKFLKQDLAQQALSITIKGNIKNKNCAFQKFTKDGPLALLPYSDAEASVVWSLKNSSQILKKDKNQLVKIINKHFNNYVSSVELASIEQHRLEFVYAEKLVYKKTILLGNIAHNIHPIAGQGLNLSIKDIALFVKQISKYKSLGYKFNDQMNLAKFETERKLDNATYSFGIFSLDSLLSSDNKLLNFTARKGIDLVDKSKYLKRMFVNNATGKDFFKSL